jgi:uncharacterized protein YndB with AHSA1/START domain
MYSTANTINTSKTSRVIRATRRAVYQACIDPDAVAAWRAPDNMAADIDFFDPHAGGAYRMSLIHRRQEHAPAGKTSADVDTLRGRFLEMVPDEKIVEVTEFESDNPQFAGEMQITTTLADADDGTHITMLFEGIPPGIRPADNEVGAIQSLKKLANLLE